MIKYEITDDLKQAIKDDKLVVKSVKMTNENKNLLLTLENQADKHALRVNIKGFQIDAENDDIELTDAIVKDISITQHYNTYGDTYFVAKYVKLRSGKDEFSLIAGDK